MTKITFYPLFDGMVIILNVVKYATNNGFTVTAYHDFSTNPDGTTSASITVSQTLTGAQQTAIQNIFNGSAYLTFT